MIPYGRQSIDESDLQAVLEVLRSDWVTTGPKVDEFEGVVSDYVCARYAVAVSSGTAALHAAMFALDIGTGDEVIVPPITFAATANCVVYQGGRPVFADVDAETLLIDPTKVEEKITDKTSAIISVDYAGQPCEYDRLSKIAERHGLKLIADSCHALGAEYRGVRVGSLADMTVFSFHPVKHITTGEGGMVTTDDPVLADRLRRLRNHGIMTDFRDRQKKGSWFYEMVDLGYNYRLTDMQCALGITQMKKLSQFLERRREIAGRYDETFMNMDEISPLLVREEVFHSYHLYVIRLNTSEAKRERTELFHALHERGIGVNVHYIPVHLHPYYRKKFGFGEGLCPVAEASYENILSLPIFPSMKDGDVSMVIQAMKDVLKPASG